MCCLISLKSAFSVFMPCTFLTKQIKYDCYICYSWLSLIFYLTISALLLQEIPLWSVNLKVSFHSADLLKLHWTEEDNSTKCFPKLDIEILQWNYGINLSFVRRQVCLKVHLALNQSYSNWTYLWYILYIYTGSSIVITIVTLGGSAKYWEKYPAVKYSIKW